MFKRCLPALFVLSLLVFAAGCSEKQPEPEAPKVAAPVVAGPDAAVMAVVGALKKNDVGGMLQLVLPPEALQQARAEWAEKSKSEPASEEDRTQFATGMAMLTQPDAEATLFAMLEPQLRELDATWQQQMPMYVAMGSGWLQGMIQENKDLSPEQREQASAGVAALAAWVRETRFTDPELARQAIAIAVAAAREVDLKTLDAARALDFDQALGKFSIGFRAAKQILAIYGFQMDQTLDTVKAEVVSNDGKAAKVRVSYTLLGTPLSGDVDLVSVDGRWYGKEAMEELAEAQKAKAEAAAATSPEPAPVAPAGSD